MKLSYIALLATVIGQEIAAAEGTAGELQGTIEYDYYYEYYDNLGGLGRGKRKKKKKNKNKTDSYGNPITTTTQKTIPPNPYAGTTKSTTTLYTTTTPYTTATKKLKKPKTPKTTKQPDNPYAPDPDSGNGGGGDGGNTNPYAPNTDGYNGNNPYGTTYGTGAKNENGNYGNYGNNAQDDNKNGLQVSFLELKTVCRMPRNISSDKILFLEFLDNKN